MYEKDSEDTEMIFCKHKWKVLDKERIPPPIEAVLPKLDGRTVEAPIWMYIEKIVTICTCEKCGEIKKFVATNE